MLLRKSELYFTAFKPIYVLILGKNFDFVAEIAFFEPKDRCQIGKARGIPRPSILEVPDLFSLLDSPRNRFYHSSGPRGPRQNSSRTSKIRPFHFISYEYHILMNLWIFYWNYEYLHLYKKCFFFCKITLLTHFRL